MKQTYFTQRFPVREDDRRPWRYRIVAGACHLGFRLFFARRIHISGLKNIPAHGPLLVCCNHVSNIDPPLLGAFTPRTLFAMAKQEMFPNRLAAWMWAGCNTFPVNRGALDRRALRLAITVLEKHGRLLVFLEGHRSHGQGMIQAEAGAGFLLKQCNVPILPCAIWGTEKLFCKTWPLPRRNQINIHYGEPFVLADEVCQHSSARELADILGRSVADLLPEPYRGAYSA